MYLRTLLPATLLSVVSTAAIGVEAPASLTSLQKELTVLMQKMQKHGEL